jgi:hypothetical protein
MTEFFQFVLSDFVTWLGFILILGGVLNFIYKIYNRTWRHANIRKHGYPPAHCDADGDFRPIKEKTDDEK